MLPSFFVNKDICRHKSGSLRNLSRALQLQVKQNHSDQHSQKKSPCIILSWWQYISYNQSDTMHNFQLQLQKEFRHFLQYGRMLTKIPVMVAVCDPQLASSLGVE